MRAVGVLVLALGFATTVGACAQGRSSAEDREHGANDQATVGEAHGHHAGAGTESIDWVQMGGSFFNFGIWLALLYFGLRRPIAEFLRHRRAAVVDSLEEARRVKEEAEAKYKEYSERIARLDAEIARLREEVHRAGMAERDRIVAEASRRAEKMREEARILIEQQLKQLREDLTREAIEAATRAAEDLLRQRLTAEDQERLVRDYLGTLRVSLRQKIEEQRL